MDRRQGMALAALSLMGLLAGCFGSPPGESKDGATGPEAKPCVHPWPCGDGTEWPVGLAGPFGLDVQHVQVPSFDGVALDGWLILPSLPAGVRAPAVLTSGPYWGQGYPTPGNDLPATPPLTGERGHFQDFDLQGHFWDLALGGYAVAVFNVRGSGASGGCFGFFSPEEQRDQAVLVDWLGNQSWSNGRVAMMGYSYLGTTPLAAAVANPAPLKAIVVAGIIGDSYTRFSTPQGAIYPPIVATDATFAGQNSLAPPLYGEPTRVEHWATHPTRLPDRACPDAHEYALAEAQSLGADHRPSAFWEPRRFAGRFGDVTAAVLLGHGLQDGLLWQAGYAWEGLAKAPKSQFFGPWGHQFPDSPDPTGRSPFQGWVGEVEAWLDFWLKGIGPAAPHLGQVSFADAAGTWWNDTAWPPTASRDEVLYLTGDGLASLPGSGGASFRSLPAPGGEVVQAANVGNPGAEAILCPPPGQAGTSVRFDSEPVAEATTLAGNPVAYLRLTSDMAGGVVAINLFDVGPGFSCTQPSGEARFLRGGAADLRFYRGNFDAIAFPAGQVTNVRIDISNLVETLPAGHRLAVAVGAGGALGWSDAGQRFFPAITVEGDGGPLASHVVLPVVQGTFGGEAPTVTYPPRPFSQH